LSDINQYKIFGERHTATNAINSFIKSNFDSASTGYRFLGWKHRRAPRDCEWQKVNVEQILFIFMVRNPYDWVLSMFRDPYSYNQPELGNMSLAEFVSHPIEDYENVIQMWNEKNSGFIRMCFEVPHSFIARQEDLLINQHSIYDKLKEFLPAKEVFFPNERYVNGRGEIDKLLLSMQEEQADIPQSVIELIDSCIDNEIMAFLDYPLREKCS